MKRVSGERAYRDHVLFVRWDLFSQKVRIYRTLETTKIQTKRDANRIYLWVAGWYPCVKEALLARGWAHNADRDSPLRQRNIPSESDDIL